MPIYEYQCGACDHEFEALQKMSDDALVDCPECSEAALIKKVSAAGFRLSGSGWYETDFKSGNKKNLAGDASSPAATKDATKTSTDAKVSSDSKATSDKKVTKDSKPAKAAKVD
jgi:putative FmdB family regulatory protein